MIWACHCAEHILPLFGEKIDERLIHAFSVGRAWAQGNASVDAHAVARESINQVAVAVARAAGHAVANAHMADHSLVQAWYVLKAVKNAGKSIDAERKWQDEQLPSEIKDLVLIAKSKKDLKRYKLIQAD